MPKLLPALLAIALIASACSAGEAPHAPSAKAIAAAATSPSTGMSSPATAAQPASTIDAPKAVLDAIHKLAPKAQIQAVDKAPIANLYQVVVQGQAVYVSADGRYMLQGNAYDLKTRTGLVDARLDELRRDALAKIPESRMIRYAPTHPKYTVTVFTDLDCPYCRAFHAQIAEYNKLGIAVNYLFWPRSGLDTPSYDKAVSVWCAADRKRAFTQAKHGIDPKPAHCENPVKHDFELGVDLGVDGTPSIVASNGAMLNGYANPMQLLQWLSEPPGPTDGG
ncbi:MAG TPA: DsbC family protein [Rhodanobacteraceae bacterium]|nr:DsbC family protein [Rhodanobacteraceae bacterium]